MGTKLDNTLFNYSELSNCTFENMTIIGANFYYSGLYNTNFINCTLIKVSFKSDLKKTIFKNCKMDKLTYALLKGYRANLENVTFIENK